MNYFLSLLLVASPLFALCQEEWQAIDLGAATSIHIEAALSAVSVTTGSDDRVRVLHELTVEGEDRADLRKLSVEVRDGVLHIKELSPTVEVIREALPDRDNDQKGKRYSNNEETFIDGYLVKAHLRVEVPEGIACTVLAEYGNVTVTDLGKLVAAQATYGGVTAIYTTTQPQDDLELKSTYGAVDLTLPARMGADVVLQTEYGDLYTDTDIDIQVGESTEKMFYHRTVGTIRGGGKLVTCHANYGDVYLRQGEE